jgi:hypothetical protein
MTESPINYKANIKDIEFSINAANNDHLVDQWMCHYFGKILFSMQLWVVPRLMNPPSFEEFMEAFYKIAETELYYLKKECTTMNPKRTLADLHEHE